MAVFDLNVSADIEVIELFLKTLEVAAIDDVHLDLGHVDILRGLLTNSNLSKDQEAALFELLQRKASSELEAWVADNISDSKLANWLRSLPTLAGGTEVLAEAKQCLAGAPKQVLNALDQLEKIIDSLASQSEKKVTI